MDGIFKFYSAVPEGTPHGAAKQRKKGERGEKHNVKNEDNRHDRL